MPSGGARSRSGPPPKPTALKLLDGNPGKRPLNNREPKPQVRLPRPPAEISVAARREYFRLGRMLARLGVMTEADGMGLAALVQSWARWLEAQRVLNPIQFVTKEGENIVVNPLLKPLLRASHDAQEEYVRLLSEFGLTPASRSRIKAEPLRTTGEDRWAGMLG